MKGDSIQMVSWDITSGDSYQPINEIQHPQTVEVVQTDESIPSGTDVQSASISQSFGPLQQDVYLEQTECLPATTSSPSINHTQSSGLSPQTDLIIHLFAK